MRVLFFLLLTALQLPAAIQYKYFTVEGPRGAYQGQTSWFRIVAYRANIFPMTAFTNDGTVVTAVGSSAIANDSNVWLSVDSGSTFPNTINPVMNYIKCETSGDTFKLYSQLYDTLTCAAATANGLYTQYPTGHGGSGTMYIGAPLAGSVGANVTLVTNSLPSGVTLGGSVGGNTYVTLCDNGNTWNACATSGGLPVSPSGQQPFVLPVVVDAAATPGNYTLQFTLHCVSVTSECLGDQTVDIDFEIIAAPTIPVSHPTITPINPTDLTTIQNRILTAAALYCNKTTGVVNWTPGSSIAIGTAGEQQIWYYDGGWAYYQIAEYFGDSDWNKCGLNVASAYAQELWRLGTAQTQRMFSDGPKRICSTCSIIGKTTVDRFYSAAVYPEFWRLGSTIDLAIRPTAYGLNWFINYAKLQGNATYAQLLVRNPTLATQIETQASRLVSQLMQETVGSDYYGQMQTFYLGLAHEILINYWIYRPDDYNTQRTLTIIKHEVDYMWNNMYNLNPGTYPGQIMWKNGLPQWLNTAGLISPQGKHCAGNCGGPTGVGAQSPQYMFLEGWAWLYWMTGDTSYRDNGDALMKTVADTYPSNSSGKLSSEMFRALRFLTWRQYGSQYLP